MEKRKTNLVEYLEMKESGLLDLKALRKDHILPTIGKPRSPGGRENLLSPNLASYSHQFTLQSSHFNATKPKTRAMQMNPNNSINLMSSIY